MLIYHRQSYILKYFPMRKLKRIIQEHRNIYIHIFTQETRHIVLTHIITHIKHVHKHLIEKMYSDKNGTNNLLFRGKFQQIQNVKKFFFVVNQY